MSLEFFNFNFFYNFIWEDLFVVFFLYNFIKYIIFCTINEIIWPTHFFNRKYIKSFNSIRFRTYSEYILKLSNYSKKFFFFNLMYTKHIYF